MSDIEIFNLLEKKYGNDVPILLNEINIPNYTENGLRQSLSRLTKSGRLMRYTSGVYYIPSDTIVGKSVLSAQKVFEKKYITDGVNIYGFYSGLTFENNLSLTTQVPNVNEIVTNKISSRARTVSINNRKVNLRSCPVNITAVNVNALQLIDFIYRYDMSKLTDDNKAKIEKYVGENYISKNETLRLLLKYPAGASKKILESGIIDALT